MTPRQVRRAVPSKIVTVWLPPSVVALSECIHCCDPLPAFPCGASQEKVVGSRGELAWGGTALPAGVRAACPWTVS